MEEKELNKGVTPSYLKKISVVVILTLFFLVVFVNAQTVSSDNSNQAVEILEDSPIGDNSKKNEFSLEESIFLFFPPSPVLLGSNNSIHVQNSSNNLSDFTSDSLIIFPIEDSSVDDLTENESANENETPIEESSEDNSLNETIPVEVSIERPAVNIPKEPIEDVVMPPVEEPTPSLLSTFLNLVLDKVKFFIGEAVEIRAILTDQNSNPLLNKKVDFYAGEQIIGSKVTDEEGTAKVSWNTSSWLPGTYTIRTDYAGDEMSESVFAMRSVILQENVNWDVIPRDGETIPVDPLVEGPINETANLDLNQTMKENNTGNKFTLPMLNETNSSKPGEIIGILPPPDLDLQLTYPSKITRGEIVVIEAGVTNVGGKAKNLGLKYLSPGSFGSSPYGQEMDCGDLDTGETCIFIIRLQTSSTTTLGINEIKVTASYER